MPASAKPPVKLSLPLAYQQEIFHELRDEDELVIIARGLGLQRIVINLLHSYDAAGNNLIVVVGAEERENGWIGEGLAEHAATSAAPKARGLTLVNTDSVSVATRQQMYSRGGTFSITSRILIVDLLAGLLDPKIITGLIVLHADRVVATSLEAFILRIYRQKNKDGFLKAFTDNPEHFSVGFAPLASMMRNLFLRRPSLWPRFHTTVAESLEGKKRAEVIELEVSMSDGMKDIQNAVLDCVEQSISELKKANTGLEMEDWNLDSALHRNFDTIVRRQLDPVWHRTSFRTRQIVRDLTLLRTILHAVLTDDAVSFNRYLDTVLAASTPPPGSSRQNQSPWLFLPAADTIFDTARRRVYAGDIKTADPNAPTKEFPDSLRPVLEEQPKWAVLADVLHEIERDNYFNPISDDSNGTTLIMCGDQNSCRQLREYLRSMYERPEDVNAEEQDKAEFKPSASFMMRRKLFNYIMWKKSFAKVKDSLFHEDQKSLKDTSEQRNGQQARGGRGPPNKRRRVRGGAAAVSVQHAANGGVHMRGDRDAHVASLLAEVQPGGVEDAQNREEVVVDPLENMDDFYELYEMKELLLVHPYDGDMDEQVLEEVKPRYIIMYEPDQAFIRRVEVYRSSHTDRNVRVYFMYYGGSVEEQRYLSAVRREKDAFTNLIKERGSMALTLTTDAHGIDDPQERFLRTVNTRIAGGGRLAATAQAPRVVIDVREFRSSLPSLCHGRAMDVVPCQLTVGDYILTPHVCVERKSVRDLAASFANGRLYAQAETMLQHYAAPLLLIEFEADRAFTLDPFADLNAGGGGGGALNPAVASDLQSKLVLLALAFPRLKVVWSSSPYQTAEIFEELKRNADEPDPEAAVRVGLEEGEDADGPAGRTFSLAPTDMLRAVPGVTARNVQRLTLEVASIHELANMDEAQLEPIIGREAGRQIVRFFSRSVFDE